MSQDERGLSDGLQSVGSVYRYDDGLYVWVDDVVPHVLADAEDSHGYRQGDDLVRCTLSLSNGTGRPFELDGVTVLVRGGPYGKTGRQVQDYRSDVIDDALEGTLRAGRRVSVTWAYSIPPGTADDLDIEVRFPAGDRGSVTFGTASAVGTVADERPVPIVFDQSVLFGEQQQSLFTKPQGAAKSVTRAGYAVSAAGGSRRRHPSDSTPSRPSRPAPDVGAPHRRPRRSPPTIWTPPASGRSSGSSPRPRSRRHAPCARSTGRPAPCGSTSCRTATASR